MEKYASIGQLAALGGCTPLALRGIAGSTPARRTATDFREVGPRGITRRLGIGKPQWP